MSHSKNIAIVLAAASLGLAACTSTTSWQGAALEGTYDAELNAKRLSELQNNDEFFELMHERRVLVFSDAKDYKIWRKTGEMPLVVTKFRAGPNGETVKFSLSKSETKAMEKIPGFKGGAQNLFDGNVQGLSKGFFGFVVKDEAYYVFENWNALVAFKKGGSVTGFSENTGPNAAKVVYVGSSTRPELLATRFAAMHDGQ